VKGAVNMRPEKDALLLDLPGPGKAVNLEASTVGQYGKVPVHETVQAAKGLYKAVSGSKVQVIGISQYDAGSKLIELSGS
jgi:hypothetical protein